MLAGLPWWLLPSLAALILVATHTYLGLHVISRNVFFVDLALAQVAALGSTVAFLYGFDRGDAVTYYVSLLFAVAGAWFFSVARLPDNRVPEEAVVGLTFAVASAGSILLSAENPHGAEHLRDILAGSILVVSAEELGQAAALYGAIGVFHWIFRRQLLQVSMDRGAAERSGVRVRLWDFLFYLSFAIVITSSVRIAGVLLVFILLIAPAVCGAMLATGVRARLLIGWGCGVVATSGGLLLSAGMDWPPAPAICCIFAALLIGSAVVYDVVRAQRRGLALARVAAVAAVGVGLALGLTAFLRSARASRSLPAAAASEPEPRGGRHAHGQDELGDARQGLLGALGDERDDVRARAAERLGKLEDPSVLPLLAAALQDPSAAVQEKAAEALGLLAAPAAVPALEAALARPERDEWVTLRAAEALVRCGARSGMSALLRLAAEADAGLVRTQALHRALSFAGLPPPSSLDEAEARAAAAQLGGWWASHRDQARWDGAQGRWLSPD